ncbi:hypothetical protein DFH09DRAFT_1317588 [Mycena vulgaris]|nr:hypothetical protein DFH09DRAFT_1317588 [Mycena vulgaris]
MGPNSPISKTTGLTPLRVNDLGINRIWRMDRAEPIDPVGLQLVVHPSPLRRDTWKLMLHVSSVIILAPAPAAPPGKRTISSVLKRKVSRVEPRTRGVLFTYYISVSPQEPNLGLPILQTSAHPSIHAPYLDKISYAGYGSVADILVDPRLSRRRDFPPVV